MKDILISNAKAIVTCDANDTVYTNCDMLIRGSRILAVGSGLSAENCEIIDARDHFVYPGLINTHHHFFQTFVRNLLTIDYPNLSVMEWIAKIYPVFSSFTSDAIYYSTAAAFADLVKHGCTCAFDHQYCYTRQTGKECVDRQMEAADQVGIRYHAGRGANTLPMSEGSSIPDGMVETTEEFLEDCDRLISKYHDASPFSMKQIVISPCQPVNCRRETFAESAALARLRHVRLHTHLGEGENGGMTARYQKRTLQWCEEMDFIGSDVFFAHCWELNPDEYRLLGETGTGISHCPAPAVLGGFPILDMAALKKQNVLISLGCDGSATNDSSNLLDSLRMAYLMQSYHAKERGCSCLSPYELLKIATINGAITLGRPELGSLEPQKAADLFMINVKKPELTGAVHDPKNLLARAGITGPVDLTMINGRVVYSDGKLQLTDEARIFDEGEKVCTQVIRSAFPEIYREDIWRVRD